FWNSGMFAFADNFITEQFKCFAPRVLKPFEKLKQPCARDYTVSKGVKILAAWNGLGAAYKKTEKISFDYAIAEKCANSAMIESNFKWIDIGSWDDYAQLKQWSQLKQRGKNDNEDLTPVFNASSNNCFVDSDIPVALAGADDLIVVIRSGKKGAPASALIVKKGQTQKVKDIVEQIKNNKRDDLL
ncbi:MAG: mannose-1-phosphate guanylyltransferase, partial [Treponema sp.]|nr:mannose-1-phosphate guanylyltransferase [Treponema sp.]